MCKLSIILCCGNCTNGSLELHIPYGPRPVLGKHVDIAGFSLGTVTMLEYWNSSRRARILAI